MAYLPSKKVLSFFIITVGLVTSIIIALGRDKASTAINYAGNIVAGNKVTLPENPEWQNDLVLTNDTILEEQPLATSTQDTLTDTVSKTVLGNYLLLKQNGTLNQQSAETLVDQSIGIINSQQDSIAKPVLNITSDNSLGAIEAYGDKLGTIFKINLPSNPETDFGPFIQGAIQEGNPEKLAELQVSIDLHNQVADELTSMLVPKMFADAHTNMIIGIRTSALGLEKIKTLMGDPLLGFVGLQMFQNGKETLYRSVSSVILSINQSGVVYKQGTGGYYLTHGI